MLAATYTSSPYIVALIDTCSRYVLNCSIFNSMEAEWVAGMIKEAIVMNGKPER